LGFPSALQVLYSHRLPLGKITAGTRKLIPKSLQIGYNYSAGRIFHRGSHRVGVYPIPPQIDFEAIQKY
jgi:hypothetical protein